MNGNGSKLVAWFVGALAVAAFLIYMTVEVIRPAALAAPVPPGGPAGLADVLFYASAGVTVAGAAGVALSRNILYSALGLLMR